MSVLFIILLTLYSIAGLVVNMNLAHSLAKGPSGRPWKFSQLFNRGYQNNRRRFGRWYYLIAVVAYLLATFSCAYKAENGMEAAAFASFLLDLFAISTVIMWFFLEAQYKSSLRTDSVNAGIKQPVPDLPIVSPQQK
ncbi:hypothetical protein [Stenotrophomonas sp. GD03657]|uniref:hypothetical protein n=1 Tax=Stenotrophomonas sp. GD03657 TaxID=2975363 RepID=UPI00244BB672|nr:hypothetical protein [Stenotrophomonas sp. GD03657]MDH2154081.1 hypothetical protein [Stenotrophomonas sp. GD03657]